MRQTYLILTVGVNCVRICCVELGEQKRSNYLTRDRLTASYIVKQNISRFSYHCSQHFGEDSPEFHLLFDASLLAALVILRMFYHVSLVYTTSNTFLII